MTRWQSHLLTSATNALDADPFAAMVVVGGKRITRAEARKIERDMWAVWRAERLAA